MVNLESFKNRSVFDINKWGFYARTKAHKLRIMKRRGYRKY